MADLHRTRGHRRAAEVFVITRDDNGRPRVLEKGAGAVEQGRNRAGVRDDPGHVDRAAIKSSQLAALDRHKPHVIGISRDGENGLDGLRTKIEHPAADQDRPSSQGRVAFFHAQAARINRRTATVSARPFQQPGPRAVLDHRCLAGVQDRIRNRLDEVVPVRIRTRQGERARQRAQRREGGVGLKK